MAGPAAARQAGAACVRAGQAPGCRNIAASGGKSAPDECASPWLCTGDRPPARRHCHMLTRHSMRDRCSAVRATRPDAARRCDSRCRGTGVMLQTTSTGGAVLIAVAQEGEHGVLPIVADDPAEARRARRRADAAPARWRSRRFRSRTRRCTPQSQRIAERCPVELAVVVPLVLLRESRRP